jgi:hypothetical protein
MEIDKKHIIEIKGKKFITFNGLLDAAHKSGLLQIKVESINVHPEQNIAYCHVSAIFTQGKVFSGIGSGSKENCGEMVKAHYVEMAQTRAIARALRFALNIDMVAFEELLPEKKTNRRCCNCNLPISQQEADYSTKFFKEQLCRSCQKKEEENKK